MTANNELQIMFKEAVVQHLKLLSSHFLGGTKENHENFFMVVYDPTEI
jgi:hypothetical protein